MRTAGDALAQATMNALLDELTEQGIDGAELQDALLSVVGIAATLAAVNGATDTQIGDEAMKGVIHGRQLLAGRAAPT